MELTAQSHFPLGLPPARFLREVWQKKPLLIRNAFPDFASPISPDELAGLACEEGALSRLIRHERECDGWRVQTGPLPESVFATLPTRDWTLLVQDVDKWDADVHALLAHFSFLPRWRIDDIMVSYAVEGGSVGAHVDQYDVFLLQGLGRRRWQIDASPNPPADFRDDAELKLLRQFQPTHDWVLEPGDMLYLPPGVPHHGVALEECLTLSVGMRAPSAGELLVDLAETLAEKLPEEARYADPDLSMSEADGAIGAPVLRRLRAALSAMNDLDDATLAEWFSNFSTRYRSAGQIAAPPRTPSAAQVEKRLAAGASLHLHPLARCVWHPARGAGKGRAALTIDGETFRCAATLARHLAQGRALAMDDFAALDAADREWVQAWVKRGILSLSKR